MDPFSSFGTLSSDVDHAEDYGIEIEWILNDSWKGLMSSINVSPSQLFLDIRRILETHSLTHSVNKCIV